MLIDAHAHLVKKPDFKEIEKVVEKLKLEQAWIMDLDDSGLEYAGFASQKEILAAAKEFKDVLIPFGFLDFTKKPDVVDRLRDKGFVGLKPYKPLKPYSHPDYHPFYERAQELGMPILFHTGLVFKADPKKQGRQLSFGPENMRPSMLAAIAEAFPKLTIIGGHLGYPWLEETAHNLYYYPNIYNDLSGYRKDVEWLIKNLDRKCTDGAPTRYFNDKILFATDCMYGVKKHEEILKLSKFWELFLEMVGGYYYRWGEPEERNKILYANAKKLSATFLKSCK